MTVGKRMSGEHIQELNNHRTFLHNIQHLKSYKVKLLPPYFGAMSFILNIQILLENQKHV